MPLQVAVLDHDVPAILEALTLARGDMVIAARLLHVRVKDVDQLCRLLPEVSVHLMALRKVVADTHDIERATTAQVEQAIRRLTSVYAVDGLEALHELATLPLDDKDSYMMDIKLKAAAKLASGRQAVLEVDDTAAVIRELNQLYQEAGPRHDRLRTELSVHQGHTRLSIEATNEPRRAIDEITLAPPGADIQASYKTVPEPAPPEHAAPAHADTGIPYEPDPSPGADPPAD